jgi:hypothetical protein
MNLNINKITENKVVSEEGKKIGGGDGGSPKNKYNLLISTNFKFYLFILILLELLIFFLLFGPIFDVNLITNKIAGDGPSYLHFTFDSIKEILTQHRTFGLPLILKIYQFFDGELIYWTKFNYIFFSFSINFFLFGLLRAKFNSIFSFVACFVLLTSYGLYQYLPLWTEIISISFCLLSLSFFFWILGDARKSIYKLSIFTFFIFLTYQIRPSFVIFTFFPILYCSISNFFLNTKHDIKLLLLMCFGPLLFFCILRFLLVGSFALVSFNIATAGKAFIFLEKTNLEKIKPENQLFVKKLFDQRNKLNPPCNLEKESERKEYLASRRIYLDTNYACWNEYSMLLWLEAIKQDKGTTPFSKNDPRNIMPWVYKDLGYFFTSIINNVGPSKILSNFINDVYFQNIYNIIKDIFSSPAQIYIVLLFYFKNHFVLFYIITIFLIIFYKNNFQENVEKNKIDKEFTLFFTSLIMFILNIILLYTATAVESRYLINQLFFFIPLFFAYFTYFFVVKK